MVEQVDKFTGDPGEAACKEAAPKVKAEAEDGCVTAKIIWKATNGDCGTAENRRKLVNQSKSLPCRK